MTRQVLHAVERLCKQGQSSATCRLSASALRPQAVAAIRVSGVDTSLSSGLFALGGTIVGGAATVASQRLTARNAERALRHAEMRAMFRDFLSAAKGPERMVERKLTGSEIPWEEMGDLTDLMWLAYQQMAAFCPTPVVTAAKAYMDAIYAEFGVDPDAPGNPAGHLMTPARSRLVSEARAAFSDFG